MNFVFLIISLVLISGFVGSVFAQQMTVEKEYSLKEIAEMKNKVVLITTNVGTFMIELFPEDAPNTVNNFLKLVIPIEACGDKADLGITLMKNLTPYNMIGALFRWQDLNM